MQFSSEGIVLLRVPFFKSGFQIYQQHSPNWVHGPPTRTFCIKGRLLLQCWFWVFLMIFTKGKQLLQFCFYLWCYLKYSSPQEKKFTCFLLFPSFSPSLILLLRSCLQKYWDHQLIRLLIWIF